MSLMGQTSLMGLTSLTGLTGLMSLKISQKNISKQKF